MKILIVSADNKLLKKVSYELEPDGYEVRHAGDGNAALKSALENRFDLVVLDWNLPEKDGLAVLNELLELNASTPVMMLTADHYPGKVVQSLNAGANDCVAKQAGIRVLAARMKAIMRRSAKQPGSDVRYAQVRIDPVAHRVWVGGNELSLTHKEYCLLEYFVRNPEQVVTRQAISEDVWKRAFCSFSNITDVYVNYLRKKMDHRTEKKLIHTVRGVGYFFGGTPLSSQSG